MKKQNDLFSKRQAKITDLREQGKTLQEIADKMGLSSRGHVKYYLQEPTKLISVPESMVGYIKEHIQNMQKSLTS